MTEPRHPCRCPLPQACSVTRLGRKHYCRKARMASGRAEGPLDWPASLRTPPPPTTPKDRP